jgi:hypothetical protein
MHFPCNWSKLSSHHSHFCVLTASQSNHSPQTTTCAGELPTWVPFWSNNLITASASVSIETRASSRNSRVPLLRYCGLGVFVFLPWLPEWTITGAVLMVHVYYQSGEHKGSVPWTALWMTPMCTHLQDRHPLHSQKYFNIDERWKFMSDIFLQKNQQYY